MGNNKLVLFFILLLLVGQSYGQNMLTKYVIIDTLDIANNIDSEKWEKYQWSILSFKGKDYDTSSNKTYDKQSRTFSLKYLKGDSLNVKLFIDDKYSTISLNHLEKLNDTIHINKWFVFHNELVDSVYQWVGYYHHIGDSIKLYKHKYKKYVTRHKSIKREKYAFMLNGKSYEIPIDTSWLDLPQWYHGYASKKDEKKDIKGGSHNRFAGKIHTKEQQYTGRLDL